MTATQRQTTGKSRRNGVTCRHCDAPLYQIDADTARIMTEGEGDEILAGDWANEVTGASCPGTESARHAPSYTLRLPERVAVFMEGTQVYADMDQPDASTTHDAEQVATFRKVFDTSIGSRGECWLTGLTDVDLDELHYQADNLATFSQDDARWDHSARADGAAGRKTRDAIEALRPHDPR